MSNNTRHPTIPKQRQFIKTLHDTGSLYYYPAELADRIGIADATETLEQLEPRISSPFAVIDPRYLGYQFPSYTFIETETNLEDGFNTKRTHFDRPENVLQLSTVLGDIDLIQRRVDADRWANAEFAKWVKSRLSYFERFETYPIFQIARWYGKDRTEPLRSADEIRELTTTESDILNYISDNPKLLMEVGDGSELSECDLPAELGEYDTNTVVESIQQLREDEIILGSSITYASSSSPWKCAVMGLSLGSGDERTEAEDPRMRLTVDHDHVITELQKLDTDLINTFSMPFITSGVGQKWADILLELRIEDIHDMDKIAERVREIEYVETTQTYLMPNVLLNQQPDWQE